MAVSREGQSAAGSEPPVLVGLLDGLIDRVQRSPLMRRPPAQCTPEELQTLAALLSDLLSLRQTRSAIENLAGPRIDQVTTYWPELGALLAASRRAAPAARGRGREAGVPVADSGSLFGAEPMSDPNDNGQAAAQATPPTSPAKGGESGTPDLAHLLLEALTVQGRALNTTQMLAWLSERGTQATREEVTTTLFRHEELFRKRGAGHWVVASQEVP
ncbi:MAG TPA: hypothetical protein VNL35_20640 [Chloroflexota bacterium]|nr:hypothetical protein [Chloroflexota bacterium]